MNQLAAETSPYLLQHKDNPVDWRIWSAETLAEARACGKPIQILDENDAPSGWLGPGCAATVAARRR